MRLALARRGIVAATLLAGAACVPVPRITYDRYDQRSGTYVNDTAGYALRLGPGWEVVADTAQALGLPVTSAAPDGTEVSMRAAGRGVRLSVQTRRVNRGLLLEQLQPAIYKQHEQGFRSLRYRMLSLERKSANGIDYVEWVYQLRSPDVDDTVVEALFLRGPYAVRLRAVTQTGHFHDARGRIAALLGSLTSVSAPVRAP